MGKDALYTMADPLARMIVMSDGEGETLNWHFDRSEFTTTLLLPPPGTLNVFRGINTSHGAKKIRGNRKRIIAVFSCYDRPGVMISAEDQEGFYRRRA